METLLTSNTWNARLMRTMAQGILALVPGILNYYLPYMPEWCGIVAVPVIMCILSPIMAELGKAIAKDEATDATVGGTD